MLRYNLWIQARQLRWILIHVKLKLGADLHRVMGKKRDNPGWTEHLHLYKMKKDNRLEFKLQMEVLYLRDALCSWKAQLLSNTCMMSQTQSLGITV